MKTLGLCVLWVLCVCAVRKKRIVTRKSTLVKYWKPMRCVVLTVVGERRKVTVSPCVSVTV